MVPWTRSSIEEQRARITPYLMVSLIVWDDDVSRRCRGVSGRIRDGGGDTVQTSIQIMPITARLEIQRFRPGRRWTTQRSRRDAERCAILVGDNITNTGETGNRICAIAADRHGDRFPVVSFYDRRASC